MSVVSQSRGWSHHIGLCWLSWSLSLMPVPWMNYSCASFSCRVDSGEACAKGVPSQSKSAYPLRFFPGVITIFFKNVTMYAQFSLPFKSKGHFFLFIIISPELNKKCCMNTMLKLFSKPQTSVGDQKPHNSIWHLLEVGFSEKDLGFFFFFPSILWFFSLWGDWKIYLTLIGIKQNFIYPLSRFTISNLISSPQFDAFQVKYFIPGSRFP